MHVIAKTDKGIVRAENQDRVRFRYMEDGSVIVVVCDGMGGENAGSEASEIAANTIFDRIVLSYREEADDNSIRNLIMSAINAANTLVYEKSLSDDSMIGMGTTSVCAVIRQNMAYIANVGDSRAYLIQREKATQISKDHTYVQLLFEKGEISEDELKTHFQRNVITRAVGIDDKIVPDYFEIEFPEDTIILLCTDGLSNYCDEEMLRSTVVENDLEEASEKLIKYANDQGGKDNITVALVAN